MHGRDEYIQSNNVFSSTRSPQLALHYVTASIPFVQKLDTVTRLRVDGDWNSLHLYHSWFLKHRHPIFCLFLFGRYFLRTISLFEFPQNINGRLVAGRKTSSVDSFSSSSLEIVAPSSSDVEFKYSWPIDGFIHQVDAWEILNKWWWLVPLLQVKTCKSDGLDSKNFEINVNGVLTIWNLSVRWENTCSTITHCAGPDLGGTHLSEKKTKTCILCKINVSKMWGEEGLNF